jgi:flagellar motility protein MotE (MotC chaperone)
VKNKIIYITSFLTAFIVVTIGIIHLNETYTNIFEFDFTEIKLPPEPIQFANELDRQNFEYMKEYFDTEFREKILDSIKANTLVKIDTVYQEVLKDESLVDSLQKLTSELQQLRNQIAQQEIEFQQSLPDSNQINTLDEVWVKKTAKLFESMNPKDAAKVIQKYSDNEARELIYKMNQKKAAAILSNLNPDFVNRITKSEI